MSEANFAHLSPARKLALTNWRGCRNALVAAGRRALITTRMHYRGTRGRDRASAIRWRRHFRALGDAWRAPANSLTGGSRAHRFGPAGDLADHRCHRWSSAALLQRLHLELDPKSV